MTNDSFEGRPERPHERIDLLPRLITQGWKRTGADQRFSQKVVNVASDLTGSKDAYPLEDNAVIKALRKQAEQERYALANADAGHSSCTANRYCHVR
ncbi:hypothetical protein ACX80N_12390 [Arthrobacter sp. MDT2-16]